MAPVQRKPHEAEFLPAALALQETPVSPAPRVTAWLLILFAALALLWAVFGKLDMVAVAHGKIVPGDRSKVIQPTETATIKRILVTDGQQVRAGELLIELDATMARADRSRVRQDLSAAALQAEQARSFLAFMDTGERVRLLKPSESEGVDYRDALQQLAGQVTEYRARLEHADAGIARRTAELVSIREAVHKLELTVPIVRQRANDMGILADQSLVARHGFLEQEQIRIEYEADLATQRSRIVETEAALREERAAHTALIAETRRHTLDVLQESRLKSAALRQEIIKADARSELTRLVSPVGGTVQQLAVHTIGGVVTPAEPLMVIVPGDEQLEVEAWLENRDIGFVKPGQEAEIKIETFQFTRYGTIPARIHAVSHDAISDEQRGLIFAMRVAMDRSVIVVDGTEVRLSPGMAVTVEAKTGKRRLIEYFLSPLIQHAKESLRER